MGYSWSQPHAKVLPTGDLEWAPKPFEFKAGASVRYIDFEAGSDKNSGKTKASPWKHHPWDEQATGAAKRSEEVDTYIFKRGVNYRGVLISRESGTTEKPIRLTSDPQWGTGEAVLCGSQRLAGDWKKCRAADAPEGLPDLDHVWFREVDVDSIDSLWEVRGEKVVRVPVAREPDWTVTNPDHVMEHWWEWTGSVKEGGTREVKPWSGGKEVHVGWTGVAVDEKNLLSQKDPDYYNGGRIWTTYDGNMGTPTAYKIDGKNVKYRPELNGFTGLQNPQVGFAVYGVYDGSKYYLENLPGFLDQPGEYYFEKKDGASGRVFLRLPEDRDPNDSVIEIGTVPHMINILNSSHIEISGLQFRFNSPSARWMKWPNVNSKASAIRIIGNLQNVQVKNCGFSHLMAGVSGFPRVHREFNKIYFDGDIIPKTDDEPDEWGNVTVSDCSFASIDSASIFFADPYTAASHLKAGLGDLGEIRVLRNRFNDVGLRQYEAIYASVPAIGIRCATVCEIAGNMIERSGGPGIWVYTGKSTSPRETPLLRTLIHHNKVKDSCLTNNDWGGIESWHGGPTYIYNNISCNAVGPRNAIFYHKNNPEAAARMDSGRLSYLHNEWACNAYSYYLDHGFKTYLFNNIAVGKSNDNTQDIRNRAGGVMVRGFMNHWFNNTFHYFLHGISGSPGSDNYILGNVFSHISQLALNQNASGDFSLAGGGVSGGKANAEGISTLAYKNNVFDDVQSIGGPLSSIKADSGWISSDEEKAEFIRENLNPLSADFGSRSGQSALNAPEQGDFRPAKALSEEEGGGVTFFVPWPLYATVGEWNFRHYNADPTRIIGEHYYMTGEFINAADFDEIPRHHLAAPNADKETYVEGPLEDWHPGVFVFDGKKQYAVLTHKEMTADYPVSRFYGEETDVYLKHTQKSGDDLMYPGEKRRTVNMDTNSFIVETYFKTDRSGPLVSKMGKSAGYSLGVDKGGRAVLNLKAGGRNQQVVGPVVNDKTWHHLLAEVDRPAKTATLFVDGKKAGVERLKTSSEGSFSNPADFWVGKASGRAFFSGEMEFLRVARGSLADSKTTIDELYTWQFNGPAKNDFTGQVRRQNPPAGAITK